MKIVLNYVREVVIETECEKVKVSKGKVKKI